MLFDRTSVSPSAAASRSAFASASSAIADGRDAAQRVSRAPGADPPAGAKCDAAAGVPVKAWEGDAHAKAMVRALETKPAELTAAV